MNHRGCVSALLGLLAGCHDAPDGAPLVTVGGRHTCVLESSGALRCFGAVEWKVAVDWVGDGSGEYVVPPVDVGDVVVHAAAGRRHVCAVTAAGDIHCWGDGPGLGLDPRWPGAPAITTVDAPFVRVAAGEDRTCGVSDDGRVWCWGNGESIDLGHDETTVLDPKASPADAGPLPLPWPVADVAIGAGICAVLTDGRVGC